MEIKFGTVLSNGATVIEHSRTAKGVVLVLTHWYRSSTTVEWVTWKLDDAGNAYYGNCYRSLKDAIENFEYRKKI
jgi:hypothetical protein